MPKVEVNQLHPDTSDIPVHADMQGLSEVIRVRAYALFEARGGESGHEVEDWLQAETEVLDGVFAATDKILISGPEPGPGVPATRELASVASCGDTSP